MAFADSPGTRAATAPSELVRSVVLAAACHVGDPLMYSAGWTPATTAMTGEGLIALQAGASGANILVAPMAMVSGFSGGTAGDPVYVDGSVAGGYTTTAPSTPVVVGQMVNSFEAHIDVDRPQTAGTTAPLIVTGANANALAVGLTGSTNPAFNVDTGTALQAAGLNVVGAVAAGTVAVAVISSGSNANVIFDAKGSGTVGIGTVSTGVITLGTATIVTSASATAYSVGPNGATNPVWSINASTASQAAGLKLTGATAAGNVALAVISSGAAANLLVDALGTGTIGIGTVSTGVITLGRATTVSGLLTVASGASTTAATFTSTGSFTEAQVINGAVTGMFQAASGGVHIGARSNNSVFFDTNAITRATLTSTALTLAAGTGLTVTDTGATITAGNFGVGIAQSTAVGIFVNGAIVTTGTTQAGIQSSITGSTTATSLLTGMKVTVTGAAASHTTANLSGIYIDAATKGASQTVTNAFGWYVLAQNIVASSSSYGAYIGVISGASTNNYGLFIEAPSGAGTANIGLYNAGTASLIGLATLTAGATLVTTAPLTFGEGGNIVCGTSTGTIIGTATSQKIGFYNTTPVVQPVGAGQAAVGTTASTQTTPFGYTTAAQADGLITHVNAMRTALVALGIVKGSA